MIDTLLSFFAIGTFGFWTLLTVLSIIFIICVENESNTTPTVLTIAFFAAYFKSFKAFEISWGAIIAVIAIYTLIGIGWSIFRWFKYVKTTVTEAKSRYKVTQKDLLFQLRLSNHKARITAWIAYWPWSVLWNITGDFFTMVYDQLSGLYESIVKNAIKDLPFDKNAE